MPSSVVLQYKRVGMLSTGRVVRRLIDPGKPIELAVTEETVAHFEEIAFAQMMGAFCAALRTFPDANAIIERTDKPGILPYVFEEQMAKLLREDPTAAIRSLEFPEQTVNLSAAKPQGKAVFMQPSYLKAGYDTFSESFGFEVYVIARASSEVECPCCGRWGILVKGNLVCGFMRCQAVMPVELRSPTWAAVKVSDLLLQPVPRFYLPRGWNEGRAWLDYASLKEKYDQFLKDLKEVPSCSEIP
jgi:hypothetical protein